VRYAENIVEVVGGTPLVRLTRVTEGVRATVLAKVEYLNPGGSVKDRIAERMVDEAEASGALRPGGTIVEPTSGNTGVGLALIAQQRGYSCIFVCPDKVGEDKLNVLRAYGARVVVTPTAVAPDSPESYYSVSDRLVREIDGAWKPNQYANPGGPASHYASTGPEIWADTDGRLTHFVAGVGTGGTITGTGRYLKDASADRAGGPVRVVGVDPEGSVYSGGTGRPYLVEGVGEDFWPSAYDPSVPDEVVAVSDAEAFAMTRRLAREEGLLVGGSCGMAVVGALRVAERLGPDDVVVVLLPDGGRGYLGKIYDDRWMRRHGFRAREGTSGAAVAEVLKSSGRSPGDIVHVRPEATVRTAVAVMREHGLAQLPVLGADLPVVLGEVAGAVTSGALLAALADGAGEPSDPVSRHMGPALPLVGAGESVEDLRGHLERSDAVLVVDEGRPVGVLTRADLLAHLAG
jgi:cystathionine beta-synthase